MSYQHGFPNLKRGLLGVSLLWFCLFVILLARTYNDMAPLSEGTLLFVLALSLLSLTAALRYRSRH